MTTKRSKIASEQVNDFLTLLGFNEKQQLKRPLTYLRLKKIIQKKLNVIVVEIENLTSKTILDYLKKYDLNRYLEEPQNIAAELAGGLFAVGELGIIFIPRNQQPQERKLFTLAHELGHYFIQSYKPYKDSNSKLIPRLFNRDIVGRVERDPDGKLNEDAYSEFKANQFAAELLMPKDLVEQFYKKIRKRKKYTSNHLVEKIVEGFGVSDIAARIRIQDLGLD